MTRLTLLRHGRPEVDPRAPAAGWRLSPDAVPDLKALRRSGVLPSGAAWWSSPEPKARATASALSDSPVRLVEDLREQERPAEWFDDASEFTRLVRLSVMEPDVAARRGWEPAGHTQARVVAAVRRVVAEAAGTELVLVGHGTAWTLAVAALTGQPPDLAAWLGMAMPDHCTIDIDTDTDPDSGQVVSGWGAWRDRLPGARD